MRVSRDHGPGGERWNKTPCGKGCTDCMDGILKYMMKANVKETNFLYSVYQGFEDNLCKRSKMIILGSLLTTFEVSYIFLEQ